MPAQGRLGDAALATADAHGCPGCPHPVRGPAVSASVNVNVNGRAALRVDDVGIHAACCGGNQWTAIAGSKTVFINGRAAHRRDDRTRHCGSSGTLVEGSPDVFVGDNPPAREQRTACAEFSLCDATGRSLGGARFELTASDGSKHSGVLDASGRARVERLPPGKCRVTIEVQHGR